MRQEAVEKKAELIENVSNVDETLGDLFLQDKEVTNDELKKAIRRACIKRAFTPVFVGTALKNKGVQPLLDGVLDYLPAPHEVKNFALTEELIGLVIQVSIFFNVQPVLY